MCSFFYAAVVRKEPLITHMQKPLNITPDVSHLWLYIHRRRKKQTVVVRHRGLSYKGRARNVTNQKTQSSTATEGKNTTPQPHHDIAFWSRLDRGKMHIHEVSNV